MLTQTVVDHFGSKTLLARALQISPASVSGWGEIIPEKQAFRLERITDGVLQYDYRMYMPEHKQTA